MAYVNKKRPYKKEYKQQRERGEQPLRNARERARRKIDKLGIVALKKDFAGSKPGRTTKYMIEYKYNEELAMSAYRIFNAFYEAYDRKGNPKLKPVLATKFRLGEYE